MASSQQRISKGYYQYSQVNNFITVKNYMFLRDNDKKCLLIRFVNDSDFVVDSMEYVVVQLGVGGEIIKRSEVVCKKMKLAPGEIYASDDALVVDDYCSDFKVVFSTVRSGDYVYTVREGRVVADYTLPPPALDIGKKKRGRRVRRFSVKRRYIRRPVIATLAPIVALILAILCVALYMTREFIKIIPSRNPQASAESFCDTAEYGFEKYVEM